MTSRVERASRQVLARLETSLGAVVIAAVDIVFANAMLRFPTIATRFLHGVWDVALAFGLGLFADVVITAVDRLPRWWLRWLAMFALGTAGMFFMVNRYFVRQADAWFEGRFATPFYWLFLLASGLGVAACIVVGRFVAPRRWFWVVPATVLALAAAVLNEIFFRDDYIELHAVAVWCASTLLGPIVAHRLAKAREALSFNQLCAAAALASTLAVLAVVPPSNRVRLALFRSPGGAAALVYGNWWWSLPSLKGAPDASVDPRWFEPREGAARPLSPDQLVREPPVVVLITIDATRADAVYENRDKFPTLDRMMREGVTFENARSAGSQTAVSLTSLFSGKYFSELRWSKFGTGSSRFDYAGADETQRFPAMLQSHGVETSKVVALTFLRNEFGVAPGFGEERVVTSGRRHATGAQVIDPLIRRIRAIGPEVPTFLYAHMTEPHSPYDRGKLKQGPDYDRYLSEIALADDFLDRVVQALSTDALRRRSILIVSADHGEAFGEHGTREHTKTIYDEMLRVPLVVWGGALRPVSVEQPVTLLDLGPTILDIFAIETPDWMNGESLVPLLAGRDVELARPIFAEGRLRRALFLGDLKVIVDLRRKTVEAFDLAKDPKELDNLYDSDPARVAPALATLRAFFEGRTYTKDGYRPIYKP
jgi:arylsulfatase A-like enzyme